MKKFTPALLLSAALIGFTPSAMAGTLDVDVASFDEIDVGTGVQVIVEVGGTQSVTIEEDGDRFDDLELSVRGSTLKIRRKNSMRGMFKRGPEFTVYVTAESLGGLDVHSGAHVEATGVSAGDFELDLSSGASIDISGTCSDLDADVSTGSDLNASDFQCNNVVIDASTGANASVYADTSLEADASTGASVRVYGDPDDVDLDTSTGGDVRMRSGS